MTSTQLRAIRELSTKNAIYDKNAKRLRIKKGRMAGTYINISKDSAFEIIKAN